MIWESAPWKDNLRADVVILRRWSKPTTQWARQGFIFEKKIFLAAYAIRKLFDARKLSDRLLRHEISCKKHRRTSKPITPINGHQIDELYQLDRPQRAKEKTRRLLDQIVHSYIFCLSGTRQGKVTGFFVTSDRDKEKHLIFVPLAGFLTYMTTVGNNYPAHGSWVQGPTTNTWKISID